MVLVNSLTEFYHVPTPPNFLCIQNATVHSRSNIDEIKAALQELVTTSCVECCAVHHLRYEQDTVEAWLCFD